jgi:hypothetical protein
VHVIIFVSTIHPSALVWVSAPGVHTNYLNHDAFHSRDTGGGGMGKIEKSQGRGRGTDLREGGRGSPPMMSWRARRMVVLFPPRGHLGWAGGWGRRRKRIYGRGRDRQTERERGFDTKFCVVVCSFFFLSLARRLCPLRLCFLVVPDRCQTPS